MTFEIYPRICGILKDMIQQNFTPPTIRVLDTPQGSYIDASNNFTVDNLNKTVKLEHQKYVLISSINWSRNNEIMKRF